MNLSSTTELEVCSHPIAETPADYLTEALQHLGVIERSPSPPPSLLERAERAEARLARLEVRHS